MFTTLRFRVRAHQLLGGVLSALLLSVPLISARPSGEKPPENAVTPKATIALHKLSNEELLKQARDRLDKAQGEYLAQLRALAAAELLYQEASKQTQHNESAPSAVIPVGAQQPVNPAIAEAEMVLRESKKKQEAAKDHQKWVQKRKELLNRIATELEATQSSALSFLNTLEDLKPYAVEIDLRLKDHSLTDLAVLGFLPLPALAKRRAEIQAEPARLKQKQAEVALAQADLAKQLEAAEKRTLAADADVDVAAARLAREQKRQEIEKTYMGKKPDELLAALAKMLVDGRGLRKTHAESFARFEKHQKEVIDPLRKELEALRAPESKIPQLARPEDVDTAVKSLDASLSYYSERIKKLEQLRAALIALIAMGGEFEGNAAVSTEHLFRMQVLSDLIARSDQKAAIPEEAVPARIEAVSARQSESAAFVQTATEKVKAELPLIEKQYGEMVKARYAAAKQLAGLKESRDATIDVLNWEKELQAIPDVQKLTARFADTRQALVSVQAKLKEIEADYRAALASVDEERTKLDSLKDPLLREAEERGQSDRLKILVELRKEAGLERATPNTGDARPITASPTKTDKTPEIPKLSELDASTQGLLAFQQLLAGRVRVMDEREIRTKQLAAALDLLEQKATIYSKTVNEARQLSSKLNAAAAELKKRAGQGQISLAQLPAGVTESLKHDARTSLDASSTGVLTVLSQLRQERERLQIADTQADAVNAATKELLVLVGQRLDLLADLKRLATDYAKEQKDFSPTEAKRFNQLASDRLDEENSVWDHFLALDSSQTAKNLSELLESYYQELLELESRQENLKKQREKWEKLIELTQKETSVLVRILPLIEKQVAKLETAREEEMVLAKARLKPDQADDLLKAYQAKYGKTLAKPVPLAEREKPERIEEIAVALFERDVQTQAARRWQGLLEARLAPTGLKAEAGLYQDAITRVNATTGTNTRRIHTLTGHNLSEAPSLTPATPPAIGGEIRRTRDELSRIRTDGVKRIAYKILAILAIAFVLPRFIMFVIRRAVHRSKRDDDASSGLVLSAIRTLLKVGVWIVVIALILSALGFDVTAIVAGLGIGGLAIGFAAQPLIADIIAAIVIFAERKFRIGDVIRIGDEEPSRVIGMSWRSTQLKNPDGILVNVPNRKVAKKAVQNHTKSGKTYDALTVTVSTHKDVELVLSLIRQAMDQCPYLTADRGVTVREFTYKGDWRVAKYHFWWFLKDYENRNKTRDEVFAHVNASLVERDLGDTEVTLA